MTPDQHDNVFERLLQDAADQALSPEQGKQLSQYMVDHPALQDEYIQVMVLTSLLRHEFALDTNSLPQSSSWQQTHDPDTVALLAEVLDREAAARKRDEDLARQALAQKTQEAREESERWKRMLAMVVPQEVEVRRRIVIPKPVFYGSIAALLAVALTLGVAFWPERNQTQHIAEEQKDETTVVEATAPPAVPQPETPDPKPEPPDPQRPVVATVGRTIAADWNQHVVLESDTRLREGTRFTLTEGFIELIMARGARVVLEAPCVVELIDDNRLRLDNGRLVARAPAGVSRFTVQTPTAQYVDLGTEFGIKVAEDGSSQMAVFEGVVRVLEGPPDEHRDFRGNYDIYSGRKTIVGADGQIKDLSGLTEADKHGLFIREVPADSYDAHLKRLRVLAYYRFQGDSLGEMLRNDAGDSRLNLTAPITRPSIIAEPLLTEMEHPPQVAVFSGDPQQLLTLAVPEEFMEQVTGWTTMGWVRVDAPGSQNIWVATDRHGPQQTYSRPPLLINISRQIISPDCSATGMVLLRSIFKPALAHHDGCHGV